MSVLENKPSPLHMRGIFKVELQLICLIFFFNLRFAFLDNVGINKSIMNKSITVFVNITVYFIRKICITNYTYQRSVKPVLGFRIVKGERERGETQPSLFFPSLARFFVPLDYLRAWNWIRSVRGIFSDRMLSNYSRFGNQFLTAMFFNFCIFLF